LLALLAVLVCQSSADIGDGLWRTFNLALVGLAPALPLTSREAEAAGWQKMSSECDPNVGFRYAQNAATPQKNTPLSIYYTAAGQVSGLATNIYGAGAAPSNLVELGYWIPVSGSQNEWMISVSFRAANLMCDAGTTAPEVLGDRLVVNQGSLNYSLPLTAADAYCSEWASGSCMVTMGEHWFYDVSTAPQLSWQQQNLLPIVTMFYPPNMNGTISTIFFTTPVKQPGADYVLYKPGDWETPALTPSEMCLNFCDDSCSWDGVDYWSTMHIYLNSQWSYIGCPNGKTPIDRECPTLDTQSIQC